MRIYTIIRCHMIIAGLFFSLAVAEDIPLQISPVPLRDSIPIGRPQDLAGYRLVSNNSSAQSIVLGYSCIKRRCTDRLEIICNPAPAAIITEALRPFFSAADSGGTEPEHARNVEVSNVKLRFEETRRGIAREIHVFIECAVVVRGADTSALIRTLNFQAHESKTVRAVKRHVENVTRAVLTGCVRQILLSLSSGEAG